MRLYDQPASVRALASYVNTVMRVQECHASQPVIYLISCTARHRGNLISLENSQICRKILIHGTPAFGPATESTGRRHRPVDLWERRACSADVDDRVSWMTRILRASIGRQPRRSTASGMSNERATNQPGCVRQ